MLAQAPKMTTYLNQGVKAKMCEAVPFSNTMGSQFVAAHAGVENRMYYIVVS